MSAISRLTRVADHTEQLGIDHYSPEVDKATAEMLERQAKIRAGKKRKEWIKAHAITSITTAVATAMLFAATQPSVADQVTKGLKNASVQVPATVPASSTSAASPKP